MISELRATPKISIIMPSFNQGVFLDQAIRSITDQQYPAIELIVMDGGSTDESVEVIKSHAGSIAYWQSEKDNGQSDAINRGFEKATGDIICWLNSDDVYLPGALNAVAHTFASDPTCNWITGQHIKFGEGLVSWHRPLEPPQTKVEWLTACPVAQPSTFWRMSLYKKFGPLDDRFHFALDYEYWVRFAFGGETLRYIERPLSGFRLHGDSKTVQSQEKFRAEEETLRAMYIDKLSASERSQLKSRLSKRGAILELAEASRLLQDGDASGARKLVKSTLASQPSLLFSKPGAVGLLRAMLNKPRR